LFLGKLFLEAAACFHTTHAMEEHFDAGSALDNGGSFAIQKASRVGGPVTCVAFSPTSSSFFVAQGPYLTRYVYGENERLAHDEKEGESRLLVFPQDDRRPRGGGTIHGIHFWEDHGKTNSKWDAIVYGAKRLAFCTLVGKKTLERHGVVSSEEESRVAVLSMQPMSILPFLELEDWIWNVKIVPKQLCDNNQASQNIEKTIVIGYARHMIEVWKVQESSNGDTPDNSIHVTRINRLFLNPPTVVTSMDFVFRRKQANNIEPDATLWIASGTSFCKIFVSCLAIKTLLSPKNGESNNRDDSCKASSIGLLEGHSGVVHSVRWFQEGNDPDNMALASTSDDRSVRKWKVNTAEGTFEKVWVGWGHSARVWSVSAVQSFGAKSFLLASVAEDGTARLWDSNSGVCLACIHHAATLRTVDTQNYKSDDGLVVIGGTDGVSAIYDVSNHVLGDAMLAIEEVAIPDDRPPRAIQNDSQEADDKQNSLASPTKKKKKAKKKAQAQVIVGVKYWRDKSTSDYSSKIVVATRQGSLLSYNVKGNNWINHGTWCASSVTEKFGIHANDGNCMAVCNGIPAVTIGTTRGDIILASLDPAKKNPSVVLNARSLRAVQGLTFLYSSCLVSFHVQAVALWMIEFDPYPIETIIQPTYVLRIDTKGIPQSCAYDKVNKRVVIGDSRGNLIYFSMNDQEDFFNSEEDSHVLPSSVVPRVHQKQHVTSVAWLNQNAVLSAGNDGCLHISYLHGNSLQKGWSYPAPSLTGISKIVSTTGSTIVSGYHGNIYRVVDVDSGYEYIRCDTGGRQRILDCTFDVVERNFKKIPLDHQLVVCKAQKDGSNRLFIQHRNQKPTSMTSVEHNRIAKGVKLHGETIFESTFFTLENQEVVFLVTASEDCTSRISTWSNGHAVDSILLTPQESCCRCVAVSQIDKRTALLVVGGGKLALQFFLVKERSHCTKQKSTQDLEIIFIGNGLTSKKGATIDHRINSISAVPFEDNGLRSHFVIAGDSEGNSHAFLISEGNENNYRNHIGVRVPTTNERPILCIKAFVVACRILILMGTTGGDIDIFDLPASHSRLQGCWEDFSRLWNSIGKYHSHQMGTNTISAEIVSLDQANGKLQVVLSIVSGGDDQALCVGSVSLEEQADDKCLRLQLKREPKLQIVREASFSAIKGVSHVKFGGQRYLVAVGYSQQLSVWRFGDKDDLPIQCTSRLPVDLGDINCLSVYQSPDELAYLVAVCGMGVEVFKNRIQT